MFGLQARKEIGGTKAQIFGWERDTAFWAAQVAASTGNLGRLVTERLLYPWYRSPEALELALRESPLNQIPEWSGSVRRFLLCPNWLGMMYIVLASPDAECQAAMLRGEWRAPLLELARRALRDPVGDIGPHALLVYADSGTGGPPNSLLAFVCGDLAEQRHVMLSDIVAASAAPPFGIILQFSPFEDEGDVCVSFVERRRLAEGPQRPVSAGDINANLSQSRFHHPTAPSSLDRPPERHPDATEKPNVRWTKRIGEFVDRWFGGRFPGWLNILSMTLCFAVAVGAILILFRNPFGAMLYLVALPLFILLGVVIGEYNRR